MSRLFTITILILMFLSLIFYNEHKPFYKDIPYLKIEKKVFSKQNLVKKVHLRKNQEIWQVKNFDFTSGGVRIFFLDFTSTQQPKNDCSTGACKFLLEQINNAESSIDFALYGIENQPKLFQALINAHNRGVKLRWVTDFDAQDKNIYKDTVLLSQKVSDFKSDNVKVLVDIPIKAPRTFASALMHNKFFIFDKQSVWTASSNLTHTDLSGFNANTLLYINSQAIAQVYLREFENLYQGKFHVLKPKSEQNEQLKIDNKNTVSVYFSPKDLTITSKIIPLIEHSQIYIYIPVFFLTHKSLAQALVTAGKRGVDIRIILDATGASNKYSVHKELRESGIKVKVENLAGKMHCKSIIIDDKYFISGSMNLTKNGEIINDENTIIIENSDLTRIAKSQFLYYWKFIPEKWLMKNPATEGFSSIGSCFDGIDNDYDEAVDLKDKGCQSKR